MIVMYADFQEKIFAEISGKKFQTFHCSNDTAMKSLGVFSRNLREKNVPTSEGISDF